MASDTLNSASALYVEIEKLNASVYPQFNQDAKFYGRLQNQEQFKVSERLVRIPLLVQPGSTFAQFVPDGTTDSMGTGGGEQYDAGVASPVFFVQACQVTKGAEWSTDGKEKSVVDVYKDSFRINLKAFRTNLEALMAVSDGSGALGTVTITPTTTFMNVSNANDFQAGAYYQVVAAGYGANRGYFQVLTADLINNILYLVDGGTGTPGQYFPTGTIATDILIVLGANGMLTQTYTPDRYTSATTSASLNGIPAINYQSSSGDWFGIPRSTWPGVLNSAYVNGQSDALVPQMFQLMESLLQRANGSDADELTDFVVHCNVDQVTAWENLGLYTSGTSASTHYAPAGVATAFTPRQDGDTRKDYLPEQRLRSMAGHELITNIKAKQQRIDAINFKYWFKTEVKPPSLFDVGGMTTFPLYGSDGGVAPTTAFYFVFGGQIANAKPRAGAYIDTLALPYGF
jgi:hypothetical protein